MSTFVSALGPGSGLRVFSQPPFGALTSVGLKERFLKTTVLLTFASAKRMEHLHAFLWTATAFDSVPGTTVSLSGRDWNTCLNHCLPPFERTETVSLSALATKSSPSHRVRTPRLQFATVRVLRFYIDRSASFRQSIQLLGAMVGVRRAEPYRNKVCHTGLWTLSRRHIQPKVWKMPSAH